MLEELSAPIFSVRDVICLLLAHCMLSLSFDSEDGRDTLLKMFVTFLQITQHQIPKDHIQFQKKLQDLK
jgi:hypothetical protein